MPNEEELYQSKMNLHKMSTFSKDNHIVEISSKDEQVQIPNIVPPVKPKEIKKTE